MGNSDAISVSIALRRSGLWPTSGIKADLACAVCKKAIKVGEGHFRIGDCRVHVKCYQTMQTGKR